MPIIQRHLAPWRRFTLGVCAALFVALPLVTINGKGLLRFDLPARVLHFCGMVLPIEKIHLLWLAFFVFFFLFLLLTLILGRVWCGWLCPQTILNDLAEWLAKRIGLTVHAGSITGPGFRRLLLHLLFLVVSLALGVFFTWYFIPAATYFERLVHGSLGPWPLGTTLVISAVVFFNLALLRRTFCKEFCPYGRFQTVLTDRHTLTLAATPEDLERCIHCGSCVRACPVGIDIRNGFQIECINCARCLDACRQVMNKRGEPGIIRYLFGAGAGRLRDIISARTILVVVLLLTSLTALIATSLSGREITIKVSRLPGVLTQTTTAHNNVALLEVHLANLGVQTLPVTLVARDANDSLLELSGPTWPVLLEPGSRTRLTLVLTTGPLTKGPVSITIMDPSGRELGRQNFSLQ